MIFRSPRAVAEALRADTLTAQDKLTLFWVLFAMTTLAGETSLLRILPQLFTLRPVALLQAAPTVVAIFGIRRCFQANRRGDNRQFIERFICLSAPVSLRVYGAYLIALVVLELASLQVFFDSAVWIKFLIASVLGLAAMIWLYRWLIGLMAYVAGDHPPSE